MNQIFLMYLKVAALAILAICFVFSGFDQMTLRRDAGGGIILFATAGLCIYFIKRTFKKAAQEKEDFYTFCGGKEKLKYVDYSEGNGIALDAESQTLFLKQGKVKKAYPFTEIREWLSGANHDFTVRVKDVDYPEWHMAWGVPGTRWFEILNQEVNKS